jgi:hypothetical protein
MLKIPDEVTIQLVDNGGHPVRLDNVVVGIRTFATHKNDIHISPFYTNADGQVRITKKDINKAADRFIDFGLMDYVSLESAKPKVEIHVWTDQEIERFINYWDPIVEQTNHFDNTEKKTLERFKTCNNKKISGVVSDNWDGRQSKYQYDLKINADT